MDPATAATANQDYERDHFASQTDSKVVNGVTKVDFDLQNQASFKGSSNHSDTGEDHNQHGVPVLHFLAIPLISFRSKCEKLFKKLASNKSIKVLTKTTFFTLLTVYIGFIINFWKLSGCPEIDWCNGEGLAFILYIALCWSLLYYIIIKPHFLPVLKPLCKPSRRSKIWIRRGQVITFIVVMIGVAVFLIMDTASDRRRLLSLGGLMTFLLLGFLFSKHPGLVLWKTVCVGIFLQLLIGLVAVRWDGGRIVFQCLGKKAEKFLEFAYVGSEMVYGNFLVRKEAVFAFQVLSAVIFLAMVVQVLFYFGWMQMVCIKLGWLVQISMGTTVIESVNVVASVFVGMTEAPLLYAPYIKDLTLSELHAIMAGCFSTVSGTAFAAYTALGVNPAHIITASVMAAPTVLCFTKLVYPETEVSKTNAKTINIYKSEDKSVMDAMMKGAFLGIRIIQGVIASLIAFISLEAFVDSVLMWAGSLIGYEELSLEHILSVVLIPVAWIIGVTPSQCSIVAKLIGIKVTLNEFIAYRYLGEIKKTGVLSPRSEAIATYALCSFANPGSIGILSALLCSLCPEHRYNVLAVSVRACVCAAVTSLLNACIVGLLMPEEGYAELQNTQTDVFFNTTAAAL